MPNPTTSTAVYNAANELTNWNGATLAYDANGNMTSDGANTYTWDTRNQLASIAGNFTAGFEYDPFGRRLQKTINGTTTEFLYDGLNPVQELSGTTATANLLAGLAMDEYFARTDASGTSYFLTDALRSSIALTDPAGVVQTEYTYDPFGETTVQGVASANSYEFTGRENDDEGLYFYRARYYSPSLERFAAEDPVGFAGGPNVYAYVGDNPVGYVDPLGMLCITIWRWTSTSRTVTKTYSPWRQIYGEGTEPELDDTERALSEKKGGAPWGMLRCAYERQVTRKEIDRSVTHTKKLCFQDSCSGEHIWTEDLYSYAKPALSTRTYQGRTGFDLATHPAGLDFGPSVCPPQPPF